MLNITFCKNNSLVISKEGIKLIKDIRYGDYVEQYDGKFIKVLANIEISENKIFKIINKDSIYLNQPIEDTYITNDNPILVNNNEMMLN